MEDSAIVWAGRVHSNSLDAVTFSRDRVKCKTKGTLPESTEPRCRGFLSLSRYVSYHDLYLELALIARTILFHHLKFLQLRHSSDVRPFQAPLLKSPPWRTPRGILDTTE